MKKVLIWGTGKVAQRCLDDLNSNIEVVAFVQSNITEKSFFKGKKIISGDNIASVNYDYVIIANTHEKEIVTQFQLNKSIIVFFRKVVDEGEEDLYELFRVRNHTGIYLSYGENCLTERLLERFCLKSFATPYSWGRSNIEYINAIEDDNFMHFLNPADLVYENIGGGYASAKIQLFCGS